MKLNTSVNKVLDSNITDLGVDFTIGDPSVIIQVLRKNFYANPIRTLVQEYICNGRDATREAKKTTPLNVTLPTRLEPTFKVRDFGVGLSEKRIKEVFTQYGKSTKRNTNEQTGGFGIGAKSAWSYTDSFTVVSYIDGVVSTYVAHIGKNHNGSLQRISQEETTEPNGTEIQVGVKEQDIRAFINAAYRTTVFWDIKPIFKGIIAAELPKFYTDNVNAPIWSGKGWAIYNSDELPFNGETQSWNSPKSNYVVVDGIPYPITGTLSSLEAYSNLTRRVLKSDRMLILHVNNGDVELVANRESMADSEYSTTNLTKILQGVAADIERQKAKILREVKSVDQLIETFKTFNNVFNDVDTVTFNDKKDSFSIDRHGSLTSNLVGTEQNPITMTAYSLKRQRNSKVICSSDPTRTIYLTPRRSDGKVTLIHKDLEEGIVNTRERIRKYMNNDLNHNIILFEKQETTNEAKLNTFLTHVKAIKLSSLPLPEKLPTEKVERESRKGKICLHQLRVENSGHSPKLRRDSLHITVDEIDTKKKHLYVQVENGAIPSDIDPHLLSYILQNGYELIGASALVIKKVKDLKGFEDFNTFKAEVAKRIPMSETEKAKVRRSNFNGFNKLDMIATSIDEVNDPRIRTLLVFKRGIEAANVQRQEVAHTVQNLYKAEVEAIKKQCDEMSSLYNKVLEDYPIWRELNLYGGNNNKNSKVIKDLVKYLNFKRDEK